MEEEKDESLMFFIKGGSALQSFALLKFFNGKTFKY